jgi:hypothetical protein
MSESILSFSKDITDAPPPPLLPVGPYPAEIIGAVKKIGANGDEYAQIVFRINAESYPADFTDGDPDGTILYYNFLKTADTPTNQHRWRVFLQKVGGPLGRTVDLNALIGLTGTVDLTHQPPNAFSDEPRAQISRILAA